MYFNWNDCPLMDQYVNYGENSIDDIEHQLTGEQENLVFTAEEDGDLYIGVRCYMFVSDDYSFDDEYNYVIEEDDEDWSTMYHITATCNGKA